MARRSGTIKDMLENAPTWHGETIMPPIGAVVLIEVASYEGDVPCVVRGFTFANPVNNSPETEGLYRVFVQVEYLYMEGRNERLLSKVRPLLAAKSIQVA
ncbi:hypothetical protein [Burkholderia phage BCSR52]|uniref:Uncharacterized protein n=1 Tax=Burkholderia phage BCSR52 TaxID=2805748 RepID=A0A889IQE7_9CAUD|nr:hypothetical protein [Burkholderia phage BCSR52]